MVTNNEAVDNFLNGKRNLAAYQFNQLIKERSAIPTPEAKDQQQRTLLSYPSSSASSNAAGFCSSSSAEPASDTIKRIESASESVYNSGANSKYDTNDLRYKSYNSDEIAFNYAMVNLFTGCPNRASIIFADLVKRYPRNPRLWLRLAESMLATERSKMSEFEHIQQLSRPNSRDHLIKTKNRPILIKINPNYCHQQQLQHAPVKAPSGTPSNFLSTIKGYLHKSLDLINEYNDISLLTDDIPSGTNQLSNQQTQKAPSIHDLFDGIETYPTTSSALPSTNSKANNLFENQPYLPAEANKSSTSNPTTPPAEQLSPQLSYSNPYKSISRSALYHLRIKVQLNLAYVSLCMGEPIKALSYTTQCLKTSPQGYEKVLASLYHAEACILASRIDEAIQFLNLEILNMARNLSHDNPPLIGDAGRIVNSEDMRFQFDRDALATVVTYNLSVAYAAKGEFNNAQKILMRCLQPTKPIPMQLVICLLYVQLQSGDVESAKKTIQSNLPQFR